MRRRLVGRSAPLARGREEGSRRYAHCRLKRPMRRWPRLLSRRGAASSISKVRAVSARSQVLDSSVGDGRPWGDSRICDGPILGIDPAVDCEVGFSIRHRDRHDNVARDRRVLLEHSLVCLQAGTRHIDRLVLYRSAYTRRVNFAAFVLEALHRFVGAHTRAS